MGVRRLAFARAILVRGDLQRGNAYEKVLVAIMEGEGSLAHWNPLDTTLYSPGASEYNSFGPGGTEHVWNYARAQDGVNSTVLTMMQPNMAPWFEAMKRPGQSAYNLALAFAHTPWVAIGDKTPTLLISEWQSKPLAYVEARRGLVAGNGPWPYNRKGQVRG